MSGISESLSINDLKALLQDVGGYVLVFDHDYKILLSNLPSQIRAKKLIERIKEELIPPNNKLEFLITGDVNELQGEVPLEFRIIVSPATKDGSFTGGHCTIHPVPVEPLNNKDADYQQILNNDLQKAIVASDICIINFEIEAGKLTFFGSFKGIFGFEPDAQGFDVRDFWQKIRPKDKEKIVTKLELAFAENKDKLTFKYKFQVSPDKYKRISCTSTLCRKEPGGMPSKIISVHQKMDKIFDLKKERNLLLNNALDIILLLNYKGDIKQANKVWYKTLGLPAGEALYKNIFEVVHPEDNARLYEALSKLGAGQAIESFEFRTLNRRGKIKWLELNATLQKKRNRIFAVARDITKYKHHYQALLRNEAHYRAIFDGSSSVMFLIDSDSGAIIGANRAAEKFYGYSKKKLERMNITDLDTLSLDEIRAEIAKTNSEKKDHYEFKHRLANGDIRDVEIFSGPIEIDGDKNLLSIVHDVTAKNIAKKALQESEEQFRLLFEKSPIGLVISTLDGDAIKVNPGFLNMLGYEESEILGINFRKFTHPDDIPKNIEEDQKLRDGLTNSYQIEKRYIKKDGSIIDVIYDVTKVYNSTHDAFVRVVQIVDITERKRAEELLKVRNHELNQFVYKVSHDLRAPLLSIAGVINLMHLPDPPITVEQFIDLINNRIKKLDNFIRDILSHSRNLNTDLNIAKVDFDEIVNNCFEELNYIKNAATIEKKVQISSGEFYSDPIRIIEIFRNIFSNSIKYADKGKRQCIIDVQIMKSARKAVIIIEDNGQGIPPQCMDKIFDMFYRANERSEGSGLGLYIVKQSVSRLQGKVKVRSEYGKGTVFIIELPSLKERD